MKNEIEIILASSSPRRKELLERLGWRFRVFPSQCEESKIEGELPADMVMRLAKLKGASVSAVHPGALVLSSDTTVAVDSEIFGKPQNADDAATMLRRLSGRSHFVYSSLALFWHGECLCDYDRTEVFFDTLTDVDIQAYVATGEPFGKAGAYAVQGIGGLLIRKVCGDASTVIGLPVHLLGRMVRKMGFSLFER